MTQEELAYGICSTGTLSKIEHGNQVPSMHTFQALMQKLGEPTHVYSIPISLQEMQSQKIYRQFVHLIIKDDLQSAAELIQNFSGILQQNRPFNEQLFSYMLCVWHSKNKKDPLIVVKKLENALNLSMPDYKGSLPDTTKRLTFHEINILNILAIQYLKMGKSTKTISYLKWMKEYFEKNDIDDTEKSRIYPMILCNYADVLSAKGYFQEAYHVSEIGKEICMSHENLIMLPFLLSCAGRNLTYIGKHQISQEYFSHASSLFQLLGCHNSLRYMREPNGPERALLAIL